MPPVDPLVERASGGDRHALQALFVRHRDDVARIAFRFVGPSGDLEDVVQEAFFQIFRSLSSFKGQSKFTTWMYRVVANVAKMHLRAQQSRPQLASAEAQEIPVVDDQAGTPADGAIRQARMRALYGHVNALSEKKRTVLVLHDFEGLTPAEISEIVDAPVLTVRTRLFYARKAVYSALANDPALAEVAELILKPTGDAGP